MPPINNGGYAPASGANFVFEPDLSVAKDLHYSPTNKLTLGVLAIFIRSKIRHLEEIRTYLERAAQRQATLAAAPSACATTNTTTSSNSSSTSSSSSGKRGFVGTFANGGFGEQGLQPIEKREWHECIIGLQRTQRSSLENITSCNGATWISWDGVNDDYDQVPASKRRFVYSFRLGAWRRSLEAELDKGVRVVEQAVSVMYFHVRFYQWQLASLHQNSKTTTAAARSSSSSSSGQLDRLKISLNTMRTDAEAVFGPLRRAVCELHLDDTASARPTRAFLLAILETCVQIIRGPPESNEHGRKSKPGNHTNGDNRSALAGEFSRGGEGEGHPPAGSSNLSSSSGGGGATGAGGFPNFMRGTFCG